MVYSTTSTPDGRTRVSIGDETITVDVDHSSLEDEALQERYDQLDEFRNNARSFQLLKHKLTFGVFIFVPLLAFATVPSMLSSAGITGSSEGLFAQAIWWGALVLSGLSLLAACALIITRSYYRYNVLSKLESEIADAEEELRQRNFETAESQETPVDDHNH